MFQDLRYAVRNPSQGSQIRWKAGAAEVAHSATIGNRDRERAAMKRQVRVAEVEEVGIRVRVESLENGRYLGTSPDVPGLVAEGRSVAEAVEIAQGLARKIVESCLENGDPLPPIFRNKQRTAQEFRVPVAVP